jgi:hypothetical protein
MPAAGIHNRPELGAITLAGTPSAEAGGRPYETASRSTSPTAGTWRRGATSSSPSIRPSAPAPKVAQVSKSWFRMRDTYGIEIVEAGDDALILAVAVCIDQMAHDVQ